MPCFRSSFPSFDDIGAPRQRSDSARPHLVKQLHYLLTNAPQFATTARRRRRPCALRLIDASAPIAPKSYAPCSPAPRGSRMAANSDASDIIQAAARYIEAGF